MIFLSIYDLVLPPIYIIVILLIANIVRRKKILKFPEYKYYIPGLIAKIVGGIFVVIIYCFYYYGGDTIAYFESAIALSNLLPKSPSGFFSILGGNSSWENISLFDSSTGWPMYWRDPQSFSVVRFTSILTFFAGKSFITTTILVATITYTGIWQLFRLFQENFPEIKRNMAIAILFMPSVFFWGSGILKDSYTLCALAWFTIAVVRIFIKKERIPFHIVALLLSVYVLISLKPYIFFAAFAGSSILLIHYSLKGTENKVIRNLLVPILIVLIMFGSVFGIQFFGNVIGGEYASVDKMINKITVMQADLVKDYYGTNTFDIGKVDPTISGLLSKAPAAITAGVFRPYLWECRNPIMLISGVENTAIMFLFLYVVMLSVIAFIRVGGQYMMKTTFDDPLVIFSIFFAISFAFFIGISTANFGALVRYKIPLIPFLMCSFFIIIQKYNREKDFIDSKKKFE